MLDFESDLLELLWLPRRRVFPSLTAGLFVPEEFLTVPLLLLRLLDLTTETALGMSELAREIVRSYMSLIVKV